MAGFDDSRLYVKSKNDLFFTSRFLLILMEMFIQYYNVYARVRLTKREGIWYNEKEDKQTAKEMD